MALSVDFSIDDGLMKALDGMKHDQSLRGLVAVIDNEKIKQHGEVTKATKELAADMGELRSIISHAKLEACFVVLRLDEKNFGQILVVPDGCKPKTRMMYASSAAHLRNQSGLTIASGDVHVNSINEITPKLYGHTEEDRKELMNEREKEEEAIKAMPAAPAPTAMAGVSCPLLPDAVKAVEEYIAGDLKAATFTVGAKGIDAEKKIPKDSEMKEVVAAVPEDQPRYILLKWEDGKTVLVYVVPDCAKPKERMPYASSKASFIAQIGEKGVKLDRKVETDASATMETAVKDALSDVDLKDEAPIAPKSVMPKGFRMLI